MTINKRSKFSRMRGSRTHKWGHKKRHRKSGNRGGFGRAGSGKRAAHRKRMFYEMFGPLYYGKHGFHSIYKREINAINLGYINDNIDKLGKKEGEFYVINLDKLGYDKVLSTGNITKKARITCKEFSKSAEEKIKDGGGEAIRC